MSPAEPHWQMCATCRGRCHWQDSPYGGWWIHENHPADDHDADGEPYDSR